MTSGQRIRCDRRIFSENQRRLPVFLGYQRMLAQEGWLAAQTESVRLD
jgi:hypothetical protein